MKTVFNPQLPVIKKGYPGNELKNGKYTNSPWPDTDASFLNVFKWFFSVNPQKKEKKNDRYQPEIINANGIFKAKEDMVVWLGHATFFIRLGGINIITDPIMENLPMIKRLLPFPSKAESIQNLDYILLSHSHRDHFDVSSLKKITSQNPNAQILGPLGISDLTHKLIDKNTSVTEAGWYQQFITDKIKITFLPALHWNRRNSNDFNTVLWGSFLLEFNNYKIYFAGDTAYNSHFKEIKEVVGKPDLCIMPIGAYKPSFLMKQSHMNPLEAIQGFKDLEGKKFIPMHFGTYDLADEPISEPIRLVKENLPSSQLIELKPGEKYLL